MHVLNLHAPYGDLQCVDTARAAPQWQMEVDCSGYRERLRLIEDYVTELEKQVQVRYQHSYNNHHMFCMEIL